MALENESGNIASLIASPSWSLCRDHDLFFPAKPLVQSVHAQAIQPNLALPDWSWGLDCIPQQRQHWLLPSAVAGHVNSLDRKCWFGMYCSSSLWIEIENASHILCDMLFVCIYICIYAFQCLVSCMMFTLEYGPNMIPLWQESSWLHSHQVPDGASGRFAIHWWHQLKHHEYLLVTSRHVQQSPLRNNTWYEPMQNVLHILWFSGTLVSNILQVTTHHASPSNHPRNHLALGRGQTLTITCIACQS